jgi:hypothetical protein
VSDEQDEQKTPPQSPGRTRDGRFARGNRVNPGGRPKARHDFVALAREMSFDSLRRLEKIAKTGTGSEAVQADRIIIEHGWGRPSMSVDITAQAVPADPAALESVALRALDAMIAADGAMLAVPPADAVDVTPMPVETPEEEP